MNIKKILELQTLTMQVSKISADFEASDISKKYLKAKDLRSAKKAEFQDAINELASHKAQVDACDQIINELLEDAQDIAELDYTGLDENELKDEEEMLKKCEARIKEMLSKLEGEKSASTETNRKIARIYKEFTIINAERDNLKQQYEKAALEAKAKLDELNAKIKAQKAEMSASDVALYEQVKQSSGKAKAFVPLMGQNCCGCGIEIEPGVYSKILDDSYGTCPNCHRVVYIPNEN